MKSLFLLSLLTLLAPLSALGQDPTIDRLLASQCAQCHGTNGYAVGDMDELAGESAKDLREDLRDMRNEDRPENIMDHQALGYTEQQIARIARFFATLPEDPDDVHEDDFEDPEDDDDDHEEDEEDEEDEADDDDEEDDHAH